MSKNIGENEMPLETQFYKRIWKKNHCGRYIHPETWIWMNTQYSFYHESCSPDPPLAHVATPDITVLNPDVVRNVRRLQLVRASEWTHSESCSLGWFCHATMPIGVCLATFTHTHNSRSLGTGMTCLSCSCLLFFSVSLTELFVSEISQNFILSWMLRKEWNEVSFYCNDLCTIHSFICN